MPMDSALSAVINKYNKQADVPLSQQLAEAGHTLNVAKLHGTVTAYIPSVTSGKCAHGANTVEEAVLGVIKLGRPNLGKRLYGSDERLCRSFLAEAAQAVSLIDKHPVSDRIFGIAVTKEASGIVWSVFGADPGQEAQGHTADEATIAFQAQLNAPPPKRNPGVSLGI